MNEIDSIIRSVDFRPFPKIITVLASLYPLRRCVMECPKCLGVDNIYAPNSRKEFQFVIAWCPGNQQAVVEHKNPFTGEVCSHPVLCSIIMVEHFHVKCNICDYTFFLSLPESMEGPNKWAK